MLEPYELATEIIPGILEKDWDVIEKKIQLVSLFASVIQIDLLDGKFAPNTTWMDPAPFAPFTKDKTFEVQMMVENPEHYLDGFAKAGFRRFLGHVEKMADIAGFVAKAQMLGDVGLAIDTETPAEQIFPYLEDIDVAFVMTVKAGFSRQQFMPDMLEKVRQIHEKAPFLPIEVDGGINLETLAQAKQAGATRFVTTGFLFDSPDPSSQYEQLDVAAKG
jgi:ribulose-phosphate 3-epimerase